jgi:hypothetical protein
MFGYRRAARAANRAALPSSMPDRVVWEAEEIVCQAWESVLLERGARMESAVQAALARCHTAYQLLREATADGDLDAISAAGACLDATLDLARRSSLAAELIRDTLQTELDLLTRTIEQHAGAAGRKRRERVSRSAPSVRYTRPLQ